MTLENLVCSRESAERLKELGVPQESYFCWYVHSAEECSFVEQWAPQRSVEREKQISAFTAGELGELLDIATKFDFPSVGKEWRCGYPYTYKRSDGKWWCIVRPYPKGFQGHLDAERRTTHDTEAEARALMLIYLLENSIIQI